MFRIKKGVDVFVINCGVQESKHTTRDVYFDKEDVIIEPMNKLGFKKLDSLFYGFLFKDKIIFVHQSEVKYID